MIVISLTENLHLNWL